MSGSRREFVGADRCASADPHASPAAATALPEVTGTGAQAEIVAIRGSDATAVARRVVAEKAAGRIPLVGDDRWSEPHWAAVVARVTAAGPQAGQGWATLTSGSTSMPRIVLRTAESWEASFGPVAELTGLRADDVLGLSSPPASSLSLFSIAHSAAAGFKLALPRRHTLTVGDARAATVFHGTPHALRSLLDGDPPPHLRTALIGGASLDPALGKRAAAAGIRVISYYGAAELSFVAYGVYSPDEDGSPSMLRPFPGVELAVRDEVLWVRSPYLATGYLPDLPLPQGESAGPRSAPGASISAGPFRREGDWATVGDRAELHGGKLRLLGRADDAILTAAATVIPAEVEQLLRGIDGVSDAVVFGVPNEGVGQLVTVVLECAHGRPRLNQVRAAAARLLAPTHLPRRWFALSELPRTMSGKPARAEIIARAKAGEVARLDS